MEDNQEQLIKTGDDCEALLKSDPFNRVINGLVEASFQKFTNGKLRSSKIVRSLITTIAHSLTW